MYRRDMVNDKIEKLIKEMTLEEKASLCSGGGFWNTKAIERLGIPQIIMTDGPNGVRYSENAFDSPNGFKSKPATCFPTASALASSWDVDLVYEVGRAIGEECRSMGIHILLAPGVNMKRTPLCGRNFEYYSEDPFLAGEMGAAFVDGVQSMGVGTSLKHFACNNEEYQRMSISSEVDERTLREIYLTAFEKVVKKSKPWTVMCSYNKINGTYASENKKLLTDILKNEWGFEGIVISDWGATNDRVKGLEAGLDLEMPGPSPMNDQKIVEAVKSGKLDEEKLNETVRRYLNVLFKALENDTRLEYDKERHHELARRAAEESMVLLKNEGRLLPLNDRIKSIAVIGSAAKEPIYQGGGSAQVTPTKIDIPFDEIQKLSQGIDVIYAEGYKGFDIDENLIVDAVEKAEKSDVAVIFAGLVRGMESEGYDRRDMCLPQNQVELIKRVAAVQKNTILVLAAGSPVELDFIDNIPAILLSHLAGQASGSAVARILFGKVSPCGKLAETYPVRLEDNSSYLNYPGEDGKVIYGERIYIGYRYYDKKHIKPRFPFGYGLSYTSFEYSNLRFSKDMMVDDDKLTVSFDIKNTGDIAAKEIGELYIKPLSSKVSRPEKELKGFKKVFLNPGESKTVSIEIEKRDLSYFDTSYGEFVAESGEYEILIGSSSQDIRLKGIIKYQNNKVYRKHLTADSPLKDWLEDEKGRALLMSVLPPQMKERLSNANSEAMWFIGSIPLRKMVMMSRGALTDDIIDRLVKEI